VEEIYAASDESSKVFFELVKGCHGILMREFFLNVGNGTVFEDTADFDDGLLDSGFSYRRWAIKEVAHEEALFQVTNSFLYKVKGRFSHWEDT